jgi:hypothetical protein
MKRIPDGSPICRAPRSRRDMLRSCANGFGAVALSALLADRAFSREPSANRMGKGIHHAPKAKNVVFLYMDGGPSQIDTFDPKPRLDREHGKPFKDRIEPTQFNNIGATLKSPWKFRQRGRSGLWVSDLFPCVAEQADELCVIRSMTSNFSEHTNANYFLHTGSGLQGRPSMGAWITYGLGSESKDLPGFVVIDGGLTPVGGKDNFAAGFLPANHQASLFRPSAPPIANVVPSDPVKVQRNKLKFIESLDRDLLATGSCDPVEAAIANYETAFRMQTAAPTVADLSKEPASVRKLYGFDDPDPTTRLFARECLLARRLVERGVRFVELTCPKNGHDRWDQHSNLKQGHEENARAVDRPIAGLLQDLKTRGLLASTLVVWAGEFGRTPFAQGADGRDHNPFGFSIWMAGGGVKGGFVYGSTDEFGYRAVENRCEMHDLHATMLHLLGVDHVRQTFRFGGRDMRLTDVHGKVIKDVIA